MVLGVGVEAKEGGVIFGNERDAAGSSRELDLDQDLDLDPSFGFVEEAFDGGGYFMVG